MPLVRRSRLRGYVPLFIVLAAWASGSGAAAAQTQTAAREDRTTPLAAAVTASERDVAAPLDLANALPPGEAHTGFKTLFKDVGQDFKHFPSVGTALWLGGGGGVALALHPFDDEVNQELAESDFADAFFAPGKYIGYGAVQIGAAVGTWAVGRASDKHGWLAHLGLDLLRAQILTQSLTYGLKVAVRRERPDGSGGYAFPSGHASTTFASATVLQRHLGWKAGIPTYAVATYVAVSRLHDNRHYLSDVIFGSALGIAGGRTVTRHGRDNYALVPMLGPGVVGVAITRLAD